MSLTATALSKMQPGDKPLYDSQVRGLHARATGKRISFYLYFRQQGQERRPKIGDYGVLTIPQAREIAREWLYKATKGEAVKPGMTPKDKLTVQDLYEQWAKEHKPTLKPESQRGMDLQWKNHILPAIGKRRVKDLDRSTVKGLFDQISEEAPTTANRVIGLIGTALRLAESWEYVTPAKNPCSSIRRNPETERQRYLTIEELQRLGAVLYDWEHRGHWCRQASRYFRLLIMTGARKSEIAKARREWLDLDQQILRLPDHKTSKKTGEKIIGLPAAAVRLIRQMMEEDPASEWLCPGKQPQKPLHNHWTAWKNILKEAQIEDLRIHDLRHSFASVGISLQSMSLDQIAPLLGHSDLATTKRYSHLMLPAHVALAEQIGGAIDRIMLPDPSLDQLLPVIDHAPNTRA